MPRAGRSTNINDGDGTKSETKSNRKPHNATGHDCSICRKSNMTLSGLKIHLLTHSGEKPYHCTVCDKRFTCSSNLKKHQRIHNKDYIYECEVCGKTCSDPSNMKKHMTVHSSEKAYVCPSCGKSYSYAQSLRQHMDDVHVGNGEKRTKNKRKGHFPCPECGKIFGYYWRCSLHQARVHAVDKPFKCPECGKDFARETILNKHLQTHEKPFSCTVCDRRFSFRDQLQKHNRIHSGEKPYQCETCLRSFSQRGSLTEHIRTHTGIKPFACRNCGQKFSSSSSLRRHERKTKSCFPVPSGEEIPMVFPNKAIYVPTPPIDIPRVETAPVLSDSPPPIQHSYMPSNSSLAENEIYPTSSTNQIHKNFDVNGNFRPDGNFMAPNNAGPISMVVRCDKNGKISVVPVRLQLVNGTQTTVNNHELDILAENPPVAIATSNYHPHDPNPDTGQPTSFKLDNTYVSMATSSDHNFRYPDVPTQISSNIPATISTPSDTLVAMDTSNYHHHGYQNEPNLATDADEMKEQMVPEYPSSSTADVKPRLHLIGATATATTSQHTTTNGIQSFPSVTITQAINPPITEHHSPTQQKHSSMLVSTNSFIPSPTNHDASSNCKVSPTIVIGNPAIHFRPILPKNQHHLSTNQDPPPTTEVLASVARSPEYTKHLMVITPITHQASASDANNNMVSDKVNNHLPVVSMRNVHEPLPVHIQASTDGTNQLDIPVGSLVAATSSNLNKAAFGYKSPSSVSGEALRNCHVAVKYPEMTSNGCHSQLPVQVACNGATGIPQSTTMELSTAQPCVKTEPEDIKPIIGIDVVAFNHE